MSTLEERLKGGTVTLGDVEELNNQLELARLEISTHKQRATGAERSREAHARASVQAIAELVGVRDFCERLRDHHADKGLEIDARIAANKPADDGTIVDIIGDRVERSAHLGASSTAESIALKIAAILTRREASEAAGG